MRPTCISQEFSRGPDLLELVLFLYKRAIYYSILSAVVQLVQQCLSTLRKSKNPVESMRLNVSAGLQCM